ncbi:hypothetical protein IGI04_002338 [Brassica rapa subsp. trilocularis]|uniref:Uncharacterized protein n=1 Tax=Brassica rapa subsp. trilocularis TaxID=1813537 RepID=A0ABQ7NXE6_BRACM|nr:hypothetical protein IGI04_002157 [Brassica rapa subsp. trilocularis]KAG5414771.1 hypothetical protein IGI04_002338 [Brassica rapa subsp. trilocularis]
MEWSSVSKPCEDVSPESGSALKRLVIQSNDRNFFIFFIKLLCARANVNEALRGLWLQKELLRRLISKAAQGYISEILRVSGQETNIKDIQGPALALVLAKVRPGFVQESFESSKAMAGAVSKGRALQTKGSRPDQIPFVHVIAIQSQSLLNTKDSKREGDRWFIELNLRSYGQDRFMILRPEDGRTKW